ncbi:MAG TPA: hypothetical protein VHH88_12255 [Verrucomicrobiae bacterium]|nr:hypothetical protein [Verrucomicrobiae bacterium]
MKKLLRTAVVGLACVACLGGTKLVAQDRQRGSRGNFDPSQFRERMMDNVKDQLEITDDNEWKAIQPLVQKVFDAQEALRRERSSGAMMMFGRSRRDSNRDGSSSSSSSSSDRSRRFRGFMGEPSPESQTLQKAIDAKASNSDLKTAIARFQQARQQKEDALKAAQDNLRKVLSVRQEAIATADGLL